MNKLLIEIETKIKAIGGDCWWNREYNDLEINFSDGTSFTFKLDEPSAKTALKLIANEEAVNLCVMLLSISKSDWPDKQLKQYCELEHRGVESSEATLQIIQDILFEV